MAENTRIRLSAVAVKQETTAGLDAFAGSPALSDFIAAEMSFTLPQQIVADNTLTGSFDRNAGIPTGIRPELTLRIPLRGSGAPATAPEWGRLMPACRFEEVAQVAAVGAPTAATAGSVRTATLGTPFAAVAQVYRGLPILLSGNPSEGAASLVQDYTAGRVATLAQIFAAALSTGTLLQIPISFLYRATDDDTLIRPVTIYGYVNGLRHRFVGCVGSWSLEMQAGQPAFISFTLRGQLAAAYEAVAMPIGWNAIKRPQPPIWAKGLSRVDGLLARCARLTFNANNTLYDPENPEAPQGYDAPIITGAGGVVEIDPFTNTSNSPTRFGKFQIGTSMPVAAMMGSVPGNRIGVLCPSTRISSYGNGNRGDLAVDQLQLTPDEPGAPIFLSAF